MNAAEIQRSIHAGISYVLKRQFADGHWEDYKLPVGSSDAWVTAFVGLALARTNLGSPAAARAASWLACHRPYPAGWGFSSTTGPDSDSTAYALLLLQAAALPVRSEDQDWLLHRWQPGGGFATYPASDRWGMAHPDVTPVAFRALSDDARQQLRLEMIGYLGRSRDSDGTWPAYWWRTRHYSTFLNASLARDLDAGLSIAAAVVSLEENRMVYSAFDLAYILANTFLAAGLAEPTWALVAELLRQQQPDGHWLGSENLRVMRHDTADPWNHPTGALYSDTENLTTTASAVWILALLASEWN
jgi:hypothetical protein